MHPEAKKGPRILARLLRALVPAAALFAAGGAASQSPTYETPPILKSSDFLDASMLRGDNFSVNQKVTNDGLFNTYTIQSPFGTFEPHSTSLAKVRINEIGAIAQLREVDKVAVAAGAAVNQVAQMGEGTLHLITNPAETAQGIGDAATRLFNRIKRSVKRSEERVGISGKNPSDAGKSTGEKVASTTQGVAKDVLGAHRAQREWAAKLGVDPYTHNPVLRDELEEVADYDAGGRFSTKLLPIGIVGTVLGSARTMNKLIYEAEPDELQTLIESRLSEMNVAADDSRAFRLNPHYTLSIQARLVASLSTLPDATGRPEFVAQAAGASAEVDARFFQESAYMAELFHAQESPVLGIVPELAGLCVIAKSDRFACLYPVDYVVWTLNVAGFAEDATRYADTNFPTARRELWLTGRASARAVEELRKRKWTVREKSMYVLPAMPAPTPTATTD
jgi:hypothetical protein